MAIIKTKDLMQAFNDVVNRMMGVGCVIYPWTQGGHQGEIAKVDLMDEGGIYRVRIDNEMRPVNGHHFCYLVEITVERYDLPTGDPFSNHNTLWKGKGEEIYRKTFYEVSAKNYTKVWTDDLDEFCRIRVLGNERYEKQSRKTYTSLTLTTVRRMQISALCREHKGYKGIRAKDIDSVTKKNGHFTIKFRGDKKALVI